MKYYSQPAVKEDGTNYTRYATSDDDGSNFLEVNAEDWAYKRLADETGPFQTAFLTMGQRISRAIEKTIVGDSLPKVDDTPLAFAQKADPAATLAGNMAPYILGGAALAPITVPTLSSLAAAGGLLGYAFADKGSEIQDAVSGASSAGIGKVAIGLANKGLTNLGATKLAKQLNKAWHPNKNTGEVTDEAGNVLLGKERDAALNMMEDSVKGERLKELPAKVESFINRYSQPTSIGLLSSSSGAGDTIKGEWNRVMR